MSVSALFNPARWRPVEGFHFKDLTFHRAVDQGTVRIAFNRPEVRNAFRPRTVDELFKALDATRFMTDVGVTAGGRSAPGATSAFAARTATSTRLKTKTSTPRGWAACTFWRCSGRFGFCPRW
jgi:1,4-dihydroxy-2-naphthoyl-CoA synthase